MKRKMNLNNLKVQSFVTDLDNQKSQTVQGGGTIYPICQLTTAQPSNNFNCEVETDRACNGGGGGGWPPSQGCSNNSCAECYTQ